MSAAYRAYTVLDGLCHRSVLRAGKIPLRFEAGKVIPLAVGAADKIARTAERTVVHDGNLVADADRTYKPGREKLLVNIRCGMNIPAEQVAELGLVHLEIAAQKHHDMSVVIVVAVNYRLAEGPGLSAGQTRKLLYRFTAGCGKLRKRSGRPVLVYGYTVSRLHVGAVIAVGADNESILAYIGKEHELVAYTASHHTGIGFDDDDIFKPDAAEYTLVSGIYAAVILLEILLRGMEGVCVLHSEFAHTDKTAAGTRLVAELCLYLVDHERIFGVRLRGVPHELDRGLLVSHAQHKVVSAPVLEPCHLGTDTVVPAGFAPERRGHYHRKQYLLSVNGVHLLTDYVLYLIHNALGGGIKRINAAADLLYITAAHHKRLALDYTVGRRVLETLADQCGYFHMFYSFGDK